VELADAAELLFMSRPLRAGFGSALAQEVE
jgi:hypothetical protein